MAEKILIVDDDTDSLKLIGLMLQRHGYEVLAASNGSQALAKAGQEIPNLIILDVMMPDMNGLEVSRRLRSNPVTEKIPIIMFTAKTLIDDKVKGFEAGADDYLTKPTHPAELASRVKAVLARSAARNAAAAASEGGSSKRGRTIGIIGAKGGVGTSSIAVNLAAAMLSHGEQPVLADFRPGQGSISLLLGFPDVKGMSKLLTKPAGQITQSAIENELSVHDSGLKALLSSTNPQETGIRYSADTATAIINTMRGIGEPAIFDLGCGFNNITSRIQAEMDQLILVIEPNPITLAMARDLANTLDNGGNSGRVNVVVVNRSQSSLQTPWHEVENTLGREIRAIISAAPELAF
ncbi:MAG: response regulator, partial [Aggregatilineales bacterium]